MWVIGHSKSLKMEPFESLGTVSYSPSIVIMAVSVAVCDIFSVKEWPDLENRVRVRSKSLEMAPIDRSHMDGVRQRGRLTHKWTDDIKGWSGRSVAECTRLAHGPTQQWRNLVHHMVSETQPL